MASVTCDRFCDAVTGPWNTSQLNCVVQRLRATTVKSCSADIDADTMLGDLLEPPSDSSLLVHTANTSCSSVDVFHAYCALAVVRHRLSDWQCSLTCCRDELTAREVAGLCRLLLWDVDVCRRRYAEELLYIHQLQTSLSTNHHELSGISTNRQHSELDEQAGASDAVDGVDKLSSQTALHSKPTCTNSESDAEYGPAAADSEEINIISDSEAASPALHQCTDWHTLPIDVKYSQHQLSVAFLQQEADRLRHLCDSINHCMVSDIYNYHVNLFVYIYGITSSYSKQKS